jgi:hypothetical protein
MLGYLEPGCYFEGWKVVIEKLYFLICSQCLDVFVNIVLNSLSLVFCFQKWHYATSRKVMGSSPNDVIEFFFNLPNPSSRTRPWGLLSL